MFEHLRKPGRAKNIMVYVIFGAICLVFVFMGLSPSNFGGITGGTGAAVVNSEVISIQDFKDYYDRLSRQYQKSLTTLPAAQRQEKYQELKEQAVGALVDMEVTAQSAAQSGVVVSDEEVREFLMDIPAFQDQEGAFQYDKYQNYISYTRSTPSQFEAKIRKELMSSKIRDLFTNSLSSLKEEETKEESLKNTKLNLEFVKFSKKDLENSGVVTPEDVQQFLAEAPNKKRVEEYYHNNKLKYTTEDEVRARHILVKVDPKKGPEAEKQALEKIKKIEKETKTNDFGELAAKYSEGPTKSKMGDLGFFARNKMVKEFSDKAFSMLVGKISEPVKTSFGYHLIKVEDKKPSRLKELSEVQDEIAKNMISEDKSKVALETFKKSIKEDASGSALNNFLQAKKLKWQETGEFNLKRAYPPKLGAKGEEVLEKVFQAKLKNGETLSDVISDGDSYYLVKLKSLKLADTKKVEKVSGPDLSYFGAGRAYSAYREWQQEMKDLAKIQLNQQVVGRQ